MSIESLPQGVLTIVISYTIDDVDAVEGYLSTVELTEKCIPVALQDAFSSYGEYAGLPRMQIPDTRTTHHYGRALWLGDPKYRDGEILWSYRASTYHALRHNLMHLSLYLIKYTYGHTQFDLDVCLYSAVSHDCLPVIHALLHLGARSTQTKILRQANNPDVARILLWTGAHARPENLTAAVKSGNVELVKVLTTPIPAQAHYERKVADTAPTDIHHNNDSLLYVAIETGNTEMINYLETRGLEIDVDKALVCAARGRHLSLMKKYIDATADPYYANGRSMTISIRAQHRAGVEYLLEQGYDVKRSIYGRCMDYIENAATVGSVEIMEILHMVGAPFIQNYDGLLGAVKGFHPHAVQKLISLGLRKVVSSSTEHTKLCKSLANTELKVKTVEDKSKFLTTIAILLRAKFITRRDCTDVGLTFYDCVGDIVNASEKDDFSKFVDARLAE